MRIKLGVSLKKDDKSWNLFVEKESELDFLPSVGEEVEDNGITFRVEERTFHLDGYVSLTLEQTFEIISDQDKTEILERMNKSGWSYRGDSLLNY